MWLNRSQKKEINNSNLTVISSSTTTSTTVSIDDLSADKDNMSSMSPRVTYGVEQFRSELDEDRFCANVSHKYFSALTSFAVFDGHGGKQGADKISKTLHNEIIEKYCQMMRTNLKDGAIDIDKSEALFCEAARESISNSDKRIKSESLSGTTLVSIFCWNQPDGSARILCPWVGDSRCVMYQYKENEVLTLALSEDHKPSLEREYNRIKDLDDAIWIGKAVERSIIHNQSFSQSLNLMFENERNSPQAHPNRMRKFSTSSSISSEDMEFDEGQEHTDETIPKLVHSHSFIGHRTLTNNQNIKGPLAICSRYNISLTMTRSIGDRYGPRCCVATPDISAVTIPHDQHARFVLASDGLWDVLSVKSVESLIFSVKNPTKVAPNLAELAYRSRIEKNIRMDDITVIIVDLHPAMMSSSPCQIA